MSVVRFPNEVADLITADSWTHGWGDKHGDGPTCLHGHIMRCDLKPGDESLIAAVFSSGPGSMGWNDVQTDAAVVAGWARAADVTDEMLADAFGLRWRSIVGLVRRLAVATPFEREQLSRAAWDAWAAGAAWDADDAWRVAARSADFAMRGRHWVAARDAAVGGGMDAAGAVVVADLVGQHGLEQHHIDTLLAPVRRVLGDPFDAATIEQWIGVS